MLFQRCMIWPHMPGLVRGGSPLRGAWGVPKISFYFIFRWEILVAGQQGRPQGSPLPDCIASMCTVQCMVSNKRYVAALVLRSGVGGWAATKRTPHDESCGLFPHLHPCVAGQCLFNNRRYGALNVLSSVGFHPD